MANERNWGGKREGAGRKPRRWRTVPHRERKMTRAFPIRIALSLHRDIPATSALEALRLELRRWAREAEEDDAFRPVRDATLRGGRISFRLGASFGECATLVHRFAVRLARRLNRLLGRRGKVFRERYRILSRPYVHVPQPPASLKDRVASAVRETVEGFGYLFTHGVAHVAVTAVTRRRTW